MVDFYKYIWFYKHLLK